MPLQVTAQSASTALSRAQARGLLPMDLSSAEIRAQLAREIRQSAVFSARMTNAKAVQAVKHRVERLLQGGYGNDFAQLRLELKKIFLEELAYDPERGFPGDEQLGIPPAKPGSLRDLSSDKRINLILLTQEELMRGAAQKARGESGTRLRQFPCWELVRLGRRSIERGSPKSGSMGWLSRFIEAGGEVRDDRMIAAKGSPVWDALGDSAIFSDALDTNHPPFAFNSGMGWAEVHHGEVKQLGITVEPQSGRATERQPDEIVPAPRASTHGLDRSTIDALKRNVKNLEERDGNLLLKNREISKDVLRKRLERMTKTGKPYETQASIAAGMIAGDDFQEVPV